MNTPLENTSPTSLIVESPERFSICFMRMRDQMIRALTHPVPNCRIMGQAALAIASNALWKSSNTISPTIDKNMAFLGLIGIIMATAGPKFFERLQR